MDPPWILIGTVSQVCRVLEVVSTAICTLLVDEAGRHAVEVPAPTTYVVCATPPEFPTASTTLIKIFVPIDEGKSMSNGAEKRLSTVCVRQGQGRHVDSPAANLGVQVRVDVDPTRSTVGMPCSGYAMTV
jgi:hypothetical protein